MRKSKLITLFLVLFINTGSQLGYCFENIIDNPLALADSLTHSGRHFEAITEYKRYLVITQQDENIPQVYYKMGKVYQQLGEWENSIKSFLTSIELTTNDELIYENRIALAISSLSYKDYDYALLELQKILLSCQNIKLLSQAYFFQTLTFIYIDEWQKARDSFQLFSDKSRITHPKIFNQLDSLLLYNEALEYKSAKKAKILSVILPGAGQFYVGNLRKSLNAFVLNSATISFTVSLIMHESYLDASLFTLFFGLRYYFGNIYHAEKAVENFNYELLDNYKAECIKLLIQISEY